LRLTDGTLMKFPAVRGTIRPGQGALLSIENGYGDVLTIKRDRNGNILEITSPHGASVILTHDKKDRITSGTDSFANTVTYSL
jgi:YD repeat-containing protein